MQFTTAALALLSTLSLTSALPATTTSDSAAAASKVSKQFYLKTSVLPGKGSHNKRFNDLYVTPYHTGAGFNDAELNKKPPTTTPAYLNGTYLLFNFTQELNFPYGMVLPTLTEYTSWQPVEINSGYGTTSTYSAFSINGTGLQWTSFPANPAENEFHGWRVCDWWHDVPQLFWLGPDAGASTPKSCSDVELCVEYL